MLSEDSEPILLIIFERNSLEKITKLKLFSLYRNNK